MAHIAIHRVGSQRMACFTHVHTNLMGAACFQRAFYVAMVQIAFQHFDVGNRLFAAKFHHRHFQAVVWVAANFGVDFAIKRHDAITHGAVNAFYRARL